LLRVVQRLLRTGADPDLRDALNRTPREIAVMRGFVDVAAEFSPAVSGASMARFLREPRYWIFLLPVGEGKAGNARPTFPASSLLG
jgi:ankyrin repeat protein